MFRDFPVPQTVSLSPRGAVQEGASIARPAATVLLVRDTAPGAGGSSGGIGSGIEVFMFRRTARMRFAAGMLVFPGGAVEEADRELAAAGPPGLTDRHVAAVRETFEECGVLVGIVDAPVSSAGGPDGQPPLAGLRRQLLAGRIGLGDVLAAIGGRLDPNSLRPWARWITPVVEPRRFDATFFLARLPVGQQVGAVSEEGEQAGWFGAADTVAEHRAGRAAMLPPTLVCLEELAAAASTAALMAAARTVRPVCPWPVQEAGGRALRVDLDGHGGGEPGPDPLP